MAKKTLDYKNNSISMELGKIPPQAIDLEEIILGALMIEKDAIDKVDLRPEYFYKDSHQKIFIAIQNLSLLNNPIDLLTVTDELRKLKWIDEIGGPYYVTLLTSKVASSMHIEYHSKIITEMFIKREIIRISTELQQRAFDESEDTFDLLDSFYSQLDRLNNNAEIDEPKTWNELIKETLKRTEEREQTYLSGKTVGIPTPVFKLTKWTCGWQPKQLIIIAGRPGQGKTAWALGCLKTAALNGYKPALFSLEMSDVSIADRIVIGESGINADDYRRGAIGDENWILLNNSFNKLSQYKNILIDDKPKNINRIRSKIKSLHRKGKCNMVIVDYIQLVGDDSIKTNANREQEVSTISRKLKLLASELNIPVIALSQLNREVEKRPNKKPMMSDLRESGAIEQDADVIMFVWRPEKYGITEDENGEPLNGRSFIILEKQREGNIGTIPFKYNDSVTAIYDYDEQLPYTEISKEKALHVFESKREISNPF